MSHYLRLASGRTLDKIAEVCEGTKRDAILYACGANATNGIRRTNADKRQAVERLLNDEEWAKWSDSEIARKANVGHTLVSTMRNEGASLREVKIDARTVTRGDTTYEQDTSNGRTYPAGGIKPSITFSRGVLVLDFRGSRAASTGVMPKRSRALQSAVRVCDNCATAG